MKLQLTDSRTAKTTIDVSLDLIPAPGDLESWETEPLESFNAWLGSRKRTVSVKSAKIYRFMWMKFIKWMKDHEGLSLAQIKSTHIDQFLTDAKLIDERRKHHRYRYVRLIELVYNHLSLSNPGLGNPGSLAAKQGVGEGANASTVFLSNEQKDALVKWISRDLSRETYARKDSVWKDKRDLAVAAVMLGGGVKVGEARALSVSCISNDGEWLSVEGAAGGPPHKTCLLPFAVGAIQRWIECRARMRFPGTWLFVSGADGRQMDAVTLYRRAQRIMERAGVKLDAREGPQTLRNAFASTLFEMEVPDQIVAGYLGLLDGHSAEKLRLRLLAARKATPLQSPATE